ncbi:MAG: mucoidy inhibitor MuiA family protein [Pseudomonadota bacterium]
MSLRMVIVCVGALVGSASPASVWAAKSGIAKVVVFADRAEVTRSGVARCEEGKAEALFERLPTAVDVRTIRAEASGKAKAIGTSARVMPLPEDRDERVARLQDEIRRSNARIRELEEIRTGWKERLQSLESFGSYFQLLAGEDARNAKPDTDRWAKVFDMARDERLSFVERRLALELELRKLERERELATRKLQALAPSSIAEGLRVQVALECNGETQPSVLLSYVVPGATWHPEYDVRFLPTDDKKKPNRGTIEITVAAVVQQSTGEDWEGVSLVLSTAEPKLGAEAPYPARITVNGQKADEQKVLVDAMERRDKLSGPAKRPPAGGPQAASLEDRGQSFVLELPRPVTVRSDGRPYWMPVDVAKTSAEAKLVAVPKLAPYVYHVAAFNNPAAYPLLAGRAHAYRKGSYMGDTRVEYKAPGEPMEISLGIDEELRIERKPITHLDKKAGLLSSTKHLERAWWIKVTSSAKNGQTVEIRESIPVSKVDDVRVELLKDKTTKGFTLDSNRGFINWMLPVGSGEEKSIDLYYTIHLPEKWQVQM